MGHRMSVYELPMGFRRQEKVRVTARAEGQDLSRRFNSCWVPFPPEYKYVAPHWSPGRLETIFFTSLPFL